MLNLMEMQAVLGLDSSNFEKGLGNAENKTNNLSATTVAVGKVMADAFEAVIRKVGEFASSVVEAGAVQEVALAKVSTIMDSSVVSTADMTEAIKKLSNEMGISVEEISDAVYNTISATGDTAHAVELTAQASKLATAGFTDTGSALSTLTTAINAYGLSAEQAEHISDSLMTVQNRGVTTVGELASSMGKAIASASAYGVNLENLESAYISITKAGINTAEGTTYISSMLKELGDSGTDVSKIIKEKTGKSFNELLADGKSLGDVLGILYDSVNGDSTALMNLWSSAEAGKASSAIVGQGIDYFNESLKELQTTTGTTQVAYETMSDTFAHKQEVMATKIENMKSTLFDKFEPMLMELFGWLEETAFPVLDMVIENIDVIAPIVLGVVTALGALAVALNITTMIDAVKNSVLALNLAMSANPIGIVIALIAGLVVALVGLYNSNEDFRNKVNEICENIKNVVTNVVNGIITLFTQTIPQKITEFANRMKTTFNNILNGFKTFLSNLGSSIRTEVPKLITSYLNFWLTLPRRMVEIGSQIVSGLWSGISSGWSWLTQQVSNLVDGLVSSVKNALKIHSPSKVFSEIGDFMALGMGEGWEKGFGDVQKGILDDMDFSAEPAVANVTASTATSDNITEWLEQNLPKLLNQDIVLDTGVLVGSTAQKMDTALGKIQSRKMRGALA